MRRAGALAVAPGGALRCTLRSGCPLRTKVRYDRGRPFMSRDVQRGSPSSGFAPLPPSSPSSSISGWRNAEAARSRSSFRYPSPWLRARPVSPPSTVQGTGGTETGPTSPSRVTSRSACRPRGASAAVQTGRWSGPTSATTCGCRAGDTPVAGLARSPPSRGPAPARQVHGW